MGLVYAPQPTGRGATSGPVKLFTPRLGPSGSRVGAIAQGIVAGARFASRHYKLSTGIGSVVTGAGVENLVGSPNSEFGETHSPVRFQQRVNRGGRATNHYSSKSYFTHRPKARSCRCNCKGRLRRTMATSRCHEYRN